VNKALVVDDNADLAANVAELLESIDLEVFLASDGEAALELLERTPVDVAIVDVRLPTHGALPTGTYEGDGSVIVRTADTATAERALGEIVSTIRLECR